MFKLSGMDSGLYTEPSFSSWGTVIFQNMANHQFSKKERIYHRVHSANAGFLSSLFSVAFSRLKRLTLW